MEKYLTVDNIKDILGFSKSKTYSLVNQKDFPKIIIGKQILVPESKFETFMNSLLYKTYEM